MSKKEYKKYEEPSFEVVQEEAAVYELAESHEPPRITIDFDAWFMIKHLPSSLKEALKCHMRARGFWDTANWDDGLKDFGY